MEQKEQETKFFDFTKVEMILFLNWDFSHQNILTFTLVK